MSPTISIIIPTFNRADCIGAAISSVLNQTFQDFEIFVVDDGSNDNTQEVVCGFNDSRIKYQRQKKNTGCAGSRNIAVRNSSAKYIAFLDDDDEWLPEKLQRQASFLETSSPEVGGVHTGCFLVEKDSGRMKATSDGGNGDAQMWRNNIATSSLLVRRECFSRVGFFDETMLCASDYDMWIRISKVFRFGYIDTPLVKYYIHQNKLSKNYGKLIGGREILLNKHRSFFATNTRVYSRHYLQLGVLYCYYGNMPKGRRAFLTAIYLYPFEIRNYFNLCLSLASAQNFRRVKDFKAEVQK